MKTRGLTDFYLPSSLAYHVRIILGSAMVAVLFFLFRGENPLNKQVVLITGLIFIQMEIFIWLGYRFFNIGPTRSFKEHLRKMIIRLLIFYFLVLWISLFILVLITFGTFVMAGADLNTFFSHLIRLESRGFMGGYAFGVLFGTIAFFYFQWADALKREQKLKEEKLIFQYETLKNQVRPHFLFNSLNTLASLVNKNELAGVFIQKLSNIYRYILDNMDKEMVELDREMDFVKDYFYLQQIRDGNKIRLEIEKFPVTDDWILPISLQLLVENALKHNMATPESPLVITIGRGENHTVVVRNHLMKKMTMGNSSGLGLKNLGQRLRLSTGRDLEITETQDEFMVKLPLIAK